MDQEKPKPTQKQWFDAVVMQAPDTLRLSVFPPGWTNPIVIKDSDLPIIDRRPCALVH